MKNLVKISLFALALGFFAACGDEKKAEEIRQILQKAVKTKAVQDSFAVDYCTPLETKTQDLPKWYEFHVNHWKKLSAGITIQ